MRTVMKN